MAYNSRFNFKGSVVIPKKSMNNGTFARKWFGGTNNDLAMISLNFGVKVGEHNIGFVELFGMKTPTVYTANVDGETLEVPREQVNEPSIIESVVQYKKIIIDLGSELGGRKEFINEYEAADFLDKNLPKCQSKVRVTGDFMKQPSKGKMYNKFIIKHIYALKEEDTTKDQLSLTLDLFYDKDSVDRADYKTEKKIYISAYVEQFFRKNELGEKKGRKMFVKQDVVFSAANYKEDNERHQNLLAYKLKYIDIKDKKKVHIPWECMLVNGAEEVEFNESMLTSNQKEQIELGIKTIEDFTPKENAVSSKITEIRLKDPLLQGDYVNGMVSSDYTTSEFDEDIFSIKRAESLKEVLSNEKAAPKKEKVSAAEEVSAAEQVAVFEELNDTKDDDDLF